MASLVMLNYITVKQEIKGVFKGGGYWDYAKDYNQIFLIHTAI